MKRLISIELRATLDRHVSAPRLGWRGLGHQIRCIAATPAEASAKSIPAPPTAASSDAIGVTVTSDLPCAPPPGSSPVYIDDADQELYSISHCLFGLTDMGTGVISLITPTTRVEQKMPLLAKWAKRELFFGQYDQWLSCLMWRSGRMVPRPAAAPPLQLAESAAGEAEGHTHTPLSENGDVHVDADVSSDATATAPPPPQATEVASEATAAASGGGDCAPLLTHMDVVGRSKIVRHMLLQYVQDPCLWWDQVRELISLAHGHHRSVVEASDYLLRPATGLVLYSAGLMTLLMDVLSMTTASFTGPKSFWYAFVITWRQNRQLPSPQRKPFSYGEVVPTLTPVDFDRRHFGAHVVQEEDLQSAGTMDGVDDALASMSTEAWEGLPEDEQNKILFGDYDASATRSLCVPGLDPSSGIYIYDDAGAEDHVMEETAKEETEGESPVEAPATIHDPRAAEQQKMLVYEMDRFLLGIIEPATTRQLSQASYAAAAPSVRKPKKRRNVTGRPKHEYLSGGRFRNASNGELEDVHLSRLWEAFQNTETTVILDAYTSVRGRLESIQTTIRSELATQIAFSMLFLSRDEVRAITAPQETYERLWRLHTQLRDIIAGPLQEEVNDNNNNKKSSSDSELPPYAELPPAVQVSYTCFGAAHLPSSSPMGHANSTVEDSHSHSLVKAESPFELFRSYVAHFDREEATVGEGVATTPHATLKNMTCEQHRAIFDSLSDLQSFSLTWCYPRNADEQSELNLLAAPAAVLEMLREETAVELIPVDASPPPAPGGRRRGRPSKASLAARQEALAADAAVAALSASGGDEGDTNTTATVEDEDYEEEEEDVPAFSSAEGETESTTTHSSSASAQVADCEDTADTPAHDDSIIRGAVEEITQTLLVNGTPAVEAHIRAQVKKIVSVVADDIATRLLQSLSQLSQAEGGEELTVKKRRKEKAVVTRRSQKKEKKKSQQPSTIITAPEREEKKQKPMKKGRKRQDGSAAATAETPHGVDDDDVQRIIEEFESRRGRTPGRKKRKKRGSSQRHEDGDT